MGSLMLKILRSEEKTATLHIFGDLSVIATGTLDSTKMQPISQTHFRFSLGGGSFTTEKAYGETLILEGNPYVSWFESGKLQTQGQRPLLSPFLMGITPDQPIHSILHFTPSTPCPIEQLYEELAQQHPQGFALIGYANAAEFQGRYVKKPPIYGEPMAQNLSAYLTDPSSECDQPFLFFGVVIPPHSTLPDAQLRRAFYRDPQALRPSNLQSHTHAALIQAPCPQQEEELFTLLHKPNVLSVAHLLTSTLIKEAFFAVYQLQKIA